MLGSIEGVIEKPDKYPPTIKDCIHKSQFARGKPSANKVF
jgi:hypothetical protein